MISGEGGDVVGDTSNWALDRSKFVDGVTSTAMLALDRAEVGVVVLDADLRFVFCNEVAATINGFSAADHIGVSVFDILPGTGETIAPMLHDVMASGVAVLGREVVGDTHARPGEVRTWTGDYLPYRLATGGSDDVGTAGDAANAVLVVFSEVTETRRAERRLRQVIDGLFTFVGLCDVDGTLLEANEIALSASGLEAGDVIGRPFWECYWWSHDPAVQELVRAAVTQVAGGSRSRFDATIRLMGDHVIPIDFQLVPVIEHGRVVSLVPSGIDVAARTKQIDDLSELTALAADLHVALDLHELVDLIVGRASGLFGTSLVTLATVDPDDGSMHITSPAELDRDIADRWASVAVDGPRTPFHDAVETGEPVWVPTRSERRDRYPELADDSDRAGLVASASLPLTDAHGVIGVLGLGWSSEVDVEPTLRLQSALFANLCAQALHRVNRTQSTMDLVNSLTTQLMVRRDHTTHFDVAVGYIPAVSAIGFGGDWYDVVSVNAQTTALIVGDVVGHNVQAAARMAVVRSALRTAVLACPDLVGVNDLVTRSLGLVRREFFATAVVVIVDTARNELRWTSFGHVPGVLRTPDGDTVLLGETGPPIGLRTEDSTIETIDYEAGSTLVLYTDGLIETRTQPIDDGIERLADTLRDVSSATPLELVDHLFARFAPLDPDDDIAIIVAALSDD